MQTKLVVHWKGVKKADYQAFRTALEHKYPQSILAAERIPNKILLTVKATEAGQLLADDELSHRIEPYQLPPCAPTQSDGLLTRASLLVETPMENTSIPVPASRNIGVCAVCGEHADKWCSQCKMVRYCSPVCRSSTGSATSESANKLCGSYQSL